MIQSVFAVSRQLDRHSLRLSRTFCGLEISLVISSKTHIAARKWMDPCLLLSKLLGVDMPKSWSEKFNNGKTPFVAPSIRRIMGFPQGSMMLIPIPAQVDEYIRAIPFGETRTTAEMADDLAKANGAELTCPMCCGMFLRICAERAHEEYLDGRPIEDLTPFWRMAPEGSQIRRKLSFGVEFVDAHLAAEGAE